MNGPALAERIRRLRHIMVHRLVAHLGTDRSRTSDSIQLFCSLLDRLERHARTCDHNALAQHVSAFPQAQLFRKTTSEDAVHFEEARDGATRLWNEICHKITAAKRLQQQQQERPE